MRNIFEGRTGTYAKFANIAYTQLMTGNWVSLGSVMAEKMGYKSSKDLPGGVSNCDNYGELRKAFPDVKKAIIDRVGEGCIVEEGNNRTKRFKYVGEDKDPLHDLRSAVLKKSLDDYFQFCQDSAGFFPSAWLDHFFGSTKDLLSINEKKRHGEQIISTGIEREQKNIELLPLIYGQIIREDVVSVRYKPFGQGEMTLVVHPHHLKEFNGRWHLFCHVEGMEPEYGYDLPLDRIQEKPQKIFGKHFVRAPKNFYSEYFKNIVGVSHKDDVVAEDIVIRAHTYYVFKLMETKRIHESQTVSLPFDKYDGGEYGEFTVHIEPNNEFFGRILQMGAGLEIVAPLTVRGEMRKRVQELTDRYE